MPGRLVLINLYIYVKVVANRLNFEKYEPGCLCVGPIFWPKFSSKSGFVILTLPPPPLGEGHCTLNLSINAIFPILILRTAEVPENYTKPPRGPKKRTSDPVLTQKHSDDA